MVYRQRIADLMKARGESQRSLSIKIGRNPYFMKDLFRHEGQSPSIDSVIAIAKALGCTVGYLVGETDRPRHEVFYLDTEDRSGEAA